MEHNYTTNRWVRFLFYYTFFFSLFFSVWLFSSLVTLSANRRTEGYLAVSGAEPGRGSPLCCVGASGVSEARLSRVKRGQLVALDSQSVLAEPFSLVHSRMCVYVGITGGIRERRFSPGGSSIGNGVLGGLRLREASE